MDDFRATAKLPVFNILIRAFSLSVRQFSMLLLYGMPAILCLVIAQIVTSVLLTAGVTQPPFFLLVAGFLVVNLSIPLVMVSYHRIFLLDAKEVSQTRVFRWTMTETRFVLWWVLICSVAIVAIIPWAMLMLPALAKVLGPAMDNLYFLWLQTYLMFLPFIYLLTRFALMFPAIAINAENRSPVIAWRLSRGNGWRLLILIGLLPALTDLMNIALQDFSGLAVQVLQVVVWTVCGVLEVAILSLSYAWLRDNCSPESGQIAVDTQNQV